MTLPSAKILFWDIESTNLKANFGYILCCGFKWLHEKDPWVIDIAQFPGKTAIEDKELVSDVRDLTHRARKINDKNVVKVPINVVASTIRQLAIKGITDDSGLLAEMAKILNSADIWVTYYGRRFDVRFVNTRLLTQCPGTFLALGDVSHVDLWETSRAKLALHSNRLASVLEHLEADNQKTPVKGVEWLRAMSGDRHALKYVVDHCRKDVLSLEEAYLKMLPLIGKHPNVKAKSINVGSCSRCGSTDVQRRGYAVTTSAWRKQRFQCNQCNGWFLGPAIPPKANLGENIL